MTQTGTKPASAPVLLIEDEPAVMAYVCAALERSGYQVVTAPSGADALRLLAERRLSGRSVRHAHSRRRGRRTSPCLDRHVTAPNWRHKVVFITGDIANEETVATLQKTGAPCVEKPFLVQQFISVVEKTMGTRIMNEWIFKIRCW